MAKPKPESKLVSYGIYTKWDAKSKALPELQRFTLEVPLELDVEFGMVVNIRKARGKQIHCCIAHPDIPGEDGKVMPPFKDTLYVRSNNWDFFLGDTIWAPIDTKRGAWTLSIELDDKVIAKKTFQVG